MIARARPKTAAAQNPLVANQNRKLSVIRTIITFITKETSPSVNQFSGTIIKFKKAPAVAFRIPQTRATISAVVIQSTSTPGTR
jgi:hypothetical protein